MRTTTFRSSDVLTPERVEASLSATGWVYRTKVPDMQDRATTSEASRTTRVPKSRHSGLVSEARLEKALVFLAETDQASAELKAEVARREYACKLARARSFLASELQGVEARKADAERSEAVQTAEAFLADAILEHEKLNAKRKTEVIIVDVFRTCEASRRVGNI